MLIFVDAKDVSPVTPKSIPTFKLATILTVSVKATVKALDAARVCAVFGVTDNWFVVPETVIVCVFSTNSSSSLVLSSAVIMYLDPLLKMSFNSVASCKERSVTSVGLFSI